MGNLSSLPCGQVSRKMMGPEGGTFYMRGRPIKIVKHFKRPSVKNGTLEEGQRDRDREWWGAKWGWLTAAEAAERFDKHLKIHFKVNSLRYRHLTIVTRMHPFDYRLASTTKLVRPSRPSALRAATMIHQHSFSTI